MVVEAALVEEDVVFLGTKSARAHTGAVTEGAHVEVALEEVRDRGRRLGRLADPQVARILRRNQNLVRRRHGRYSSVVN